MSTDSIEFYNNNAKQYIHSINGVDISDQLVSFTALMPPGGKILDGGCGTGRDSAFMIEQGYNVTAFDGSKEMAKIAAQNTGLNVMVETFENINLPRSYFDGIWCMSSLLHVHRNNMLFVFEKLYDALVPGGYFYCTFKLRDNDFSDGKRHFTCYTELSFKELIRKTKFKIDYISELDDLRPNRSDEKWLCVLLRKR